ncbi:hypothetical protein [Corynebacterium camporealensis]|uniref:Ferredoxin-like protein n=1 Tax=Corynebacterium camporealensis TaxID=161896 RepID=A0A0F6QVV6_9CORY|nr:hypothetical protein [Corynebacterium camporealensis]AKE38600.1 hypothetical protein UL81_03095 [Corynebacterium camporealensis]MDY5839225.1 hypothetical protein [Corynebacterium camporealensis]
MSFRRKPNPNRNHPAHCPYCAGTQLFPDEEGEFAWKCTECQRIFSVMFHGQDDAPVRPSPTLSSQEALQRSLKRRGHSTARG